MANDLFPKLPRRTPPPVRRPARFNKGRRTRYDGRHEAARELTIAEAVDRVRTNLQRMGIDDDDLVISSNLELRLDGLPRSNQREPTDPGVAVYWVDRFDRSQPPKCMAIDQYDRVADNLAAVAANLDAMCAIERRGGATILARAFAGFAALPGPTAADCRAVLDPADPEGSYKRLRAQHHSDRDGDAATFQQVQDAWSSHKAEGC
ncbi:J domain-containing protein [Xanthomonas translucens pv. translucens]|uniref:J domain-containing protein n=1 Tax=Xanthomonas campestris pv. translucens TaxID=343 RepID=UPI003F728356